MCKWELFFYFCKKKYFFPKMENIFLPKNKIKEKKKKMRPPYWLQKRTPAGPETEVFFRLALCPNIETYVDIPGRRLCLHNPRVLLYYNLGAQSGLIRS